MAVSFLLLFLSTGEVQEVDFLTCRLQEVRGHVLCLRIRDV